MINKRHKRTSTSISTVQILCVFGYIMNKFINIIITFLLGESMITPTIRHGAGETSCRGVPVEFSKTDNASFIIGGMFPLHFLNKEKLYQYNSPGLMWVEAMLFAIEEINKIPELLPNATLGYRIFDSCNTIGTAIEATLLLTNGQSYYDTGDSQTCPCNPTIDRIVGLVGDAASATTTKVASLLAATRTPQISYSATSTDLSKKNLFPSFMRTLPPDNFQAKLITDLMLKYRWKYINVIACDDQYGRVGVDELLPELKLQGVCVAVLEVFDVKHDDGRNIKRVVKRLKAETQATVVVLWCQRPEALRVLRSAEDEELYHRTWIATETYGKTSDVYEIDHRVVKGMFGIIPAQITYKPFADTLKAITPNNSDNNPWLDEYWIKKKNCKKILNAESVPKYICPDKETDLSGLPTNKYVNVIDAVYAIAHGLHNYINIGNNSDGTIDIQMLNEYVKKVNFTGKSNIAVSFNSEGNPTVALYSITNVQYRKSSLYHEEVGNWDDASRKISIHGEIQFAGQFNMTPMSSCAEFCSPGFYGLRFGDKPCCWKCIACPEGEIQSQTGQHECLKCTNGKMANSKRTMCIEPKMVSLNVEKTSGIIVLSFMVIGGLLIVSCVMVFIIKRNTPIVKASNKGLSILQIASMLFQLALPVIFFQKELNTELCGASLFYFIFFNTITVSVTFTKADRLLGVFRASKTGMLSKKSKMKGNSLQYFKVCLLTLIGLALCIIMFVVFKPKAMTEKKYDGDVIHVLTYCGGYYDSILFSMIAYIVMISLVCSMYAFKARKLPHDYNEARFTSFSMFTFLLIWVMAVPIYFSRDDKIDKVASWCILTLLSTLSIFIPMYMPKIYVILFKPEENTVEHFRENLKQTALNANAKPKLTIKYITSTNEQSSTMESATVSFVSEDQK